MTWQLKGLDNQAFLRQYWQQKPCLIRQAFADFKSPISPQELAGLACEDEVHSRLIVENVADQSWALSYGPFQESDFLALPETHYSLLVSECEKWIPELRELLQAFRFLPDWRIDDLMISYAPPGGSVGPHSDEYDVFLLQAQGQRKWQYSDQRVENPALIAGLDLAILEHFNPTEESILLPGDILYLPPGIAHHGVAVDHCMTFSIGFRAPADIEVLDSLSLELSQQEQPSKRYSDPLLNRQRHFCEITQEEINRFKQLVSESMQQSDSLWIDAIGKLLSDSPVRNADLDTPVDCPDKLPVGDWQSSPDSRLLFHRGESILYFYCDGVGYQLPVSTVALEFVQKLCELRAVRTQDADSCESLQRLLSDLVSHGSLIPAET